MMRILITMLALGFTLGATLPAVAQIVDTEKSFQDVAFEQKLGEPVDLSLPFVDDEGNAVTLADYFHEGRPVILALVYFECPMLCNMVLNGTVRSLRPLTMDPSEDFEIVVVSFDPDEDYRIAHAKMGNYIQSYSRPGTEDGWHFLTGTTASIDALTDQVGFRYVYDEATDQFAHASGITVLTPEGMVSRYLFGIDFPPKDLRLALTEASDGEVGGVVEQLLLLCFSYDPTTGRYGATIMFFIRLAAGLTVLVLVGAIIWSRRRENRRRQHALEGAA